MKLAASILALAVSLGPSHGVSSAPRDAFEVLFSGGPVEGCQILSIGWNIPPDEVLERLGRAPGSSPGRGRLFLSFPVCERPETDAPESDAHGAWITLAIDESRYVCLDIWAIVPQGAMADHLRSAGHRVLAGEASFDLVLDREGEGFVVDTVIELPKGTVHIYGTVPQIPQQACTTAEIAKNAAAPVVSTADTIEVAVSGRASILGSAEKRSPGVVTWSCDLMLALARVAASDVLSQPRDRVGGNR